MDRKFLISGVLSVVLLMLVIMLENAHVKSIWILLPIGLVAILNLGYMLSRIIKDGKLEQKERKLRKQNRKKKEPM